MIDELRFVMVAKKLKEFSEYFDDLYELIDNIIERKHSVNGMTAHIIGINRFSDKNIEYSWGCDGCSRGCCGYITGEDEISYDDLLNFIQGEK